MLAGTAMDGLMGRTNEVKKKEQDETFYLRYLNAKIAMYLNF